MGDFAAVDNFSKLLPVGGCAVLFLIKPFHKFLGKECK
jgi:hypothetical protein